MTWHRFLLHAALPTTIPTAVFDALSTNISKLLKEPRLEAEKIVTEFLFFRAVTRKRWIDVMERRISPEQLTKQVKLLDERDLTSFFRTTRRGIVLTSMHAGEYLSALLKVADILPPEKKLMILRKAEAQTNSANDVIPTLAGALEVIEDDERSLRRCVRALRDGHILVVLFDLPAKTNATAEVIFFDQQINWIKSPVDLARLGRADILPLTTYLSDQGDH